MAREKFYPPNIEGTIPAFYTDPLKGTKLIVPFSMNRTVDKNKVKGMQVKIKTIQSGAYILDAYTEDIVYDPYCVATFVLGDNIQELPATFHVGQHYKIQIAYKSYGEKDNLDGGVIGYFSTVGVVKYTKKPTITIQGLEGKSINMHQYDYIGVYSNADTSEKVYSYQFNLYDTKNNLLQTTGEKIHNAELDDLLLKEQYDAYQIKYDLELNKIYYLEYVVTTVNKLQVSSGQYRIMQKNSINPEIKARLEPTLNYENGYVDLRLIGEKNADGAEYAATGTFKVLRASDEDGYGAWQEVLRFALYGQQPSRWMWRDHTVKQGVSYKYALQQYNETLTSNRLESEAIYVDFEHAFLYDGERQLKIKYNPKVTGFKNTLLESKINTIGSKYPFVFRNGNVKYKEFSISGLISCLMDDDFMFINQKSLGEYDFSANLTGNNIASEREFKLEVMEWLNNGEPKLFRSPTEGNYIVRLINVSLAPDDKLGRMLHTFTATACEIADYDYKNLNNLGLISIGDPTTRQLRWETVELDKAGIGAKENILNYKAVSLHFEGMIPGDRLWIDDGIVHQTPVTDDDGNVILNSQGSITYKPVYSDGKTGYEVIIGVTGSYIISLKENVEISNIHFLGSQDSTSSGMGIVQHQGILTYAYYSKVQNRFDAISNFEIKDIPLEQFMGEHDIFAEIEDIKNSIQDIYWIHCMLRERQTIYLYDGKYYADQAHIKQIELDPYVLYTVNTIEPVNNTMTEVQYLLDGASQKEYRDSKAICSTYVEFNGKPMDLTETYEYTIKAPKDIKQLTTGNGVMVEIGYQKQIIEYSVESDNMNYEELIKSKNNVTNKYKTLMNMIYNYMDDDREIKTTEARADYQDTYNQYIEQLTLALAEKEAAQGESAIR